MPLPFFFGVSLSKETLSHINPEFARTSRGSGTRQKGLYVSQRAHYVYRPVPQRIIQGYCKGKFCTICLRTLGTTLSADTRIGIFFSAVSILWETLLKI